MSNPDAIRSVITQLFDEPNAERYDAVTARFGETATLRAPRQVQVTGRPAILDFFRASFAPFATHIEQPSRILVSGATATVELRFAGTVPSGRPLTFNGVDIFDFDSTNRISAVSVWHDSFTLNRQLKSLLSDAS